MFPDVNSRSRCTEIRKRPYCDRTSVRGLAGRERGTKKTFILDYGALVYIPSFVGNKIDVKIPQYFTRYHSAVVVTAGRRNPAPPPTNTTTLGQLLLRSGGGGKILGERSEGALEDGEREWRIGGSFEGLPWSYCSLVESKHGKCVCMPNGYWYIIQLV